MLLCLGGLASACASPVHTHSISTPKIQSPPVPSGTTAPDESLTSIPGAALGSGEAECIIANLKFAVGPLVSPETGQNPVPVTITNVGPVPCELDGYPTVTFRDNHGAVVPFTFRHGDQEVTAHPPQSVVIDPTRAAYMLVNKYRCDVHEFSVAAVMEIALPGQPQSRSVASSYPFCGVGDPGSVVAVSPIEPDLQATFDF